MLHLPSVCILGIDCHRPNLTLRMMVESMRFVKFGRAVCLTDTVKHNQLLGKCRAEGVEIIHHTQTDRKESPFPGHSLLPVDYERDIMVEPEKYSDLGFVHVIEWDSCVLNPKAWTNEFLECDYIGAPWTPHNDPGWPACDGQTNAVGNGGFSLRSRKFCQKVAMSLPMFKHDPQMCRQMMSSDRYMCRSLRPWLERQGVRFAPVGLAWKFSCENRVYTGEWGMHGKATFEINNFARWFAHIRH